MPLLLFFCLLSLRTIDGVPHEQSLAEDLEQLNSRLVTQFELHSRIDFVQQGITQHIKGRLRVRDDNFEELTDETGRKLDKFFQQKVTALQKIVESAEKEINGLSYDEIFVNNEEDCDNYKQKIKLANVYNTPVDAKANQSGIHVAVESFKCDNGVVRDFEWTGMNKIEKSFVENAQKDKNLLRQYIGTYSGVTRLYPTFQWETEPLLSIDLFDSRYRPWFINAETAPKDILFLLDYSGSVKGQNLHLIKMGIMAILAQLNPNDFFNAIWYNSKSDFMLKPCTDERFITATTRNKRLFQDFLNKIEEHDQATFPPAVNISIAKYLSDEYTSATRQNQTSGGHQLIFVFTDGVEFWPIEEIRRFKSENPDRTIRVFGFAVGPGTGEIKALQWTTCETGGAYANVDRIPDVKRTSRMYLSKLSEPLAYSLKSKSVQKRPVSFSFPYMDAQKEGAVLSISAPILNRMFTSNGTVDPEENNNFIGVAGVDVSLERLRLMLPNTEQIKSFIVDNNGVVIFHPKLKLPAREIYSIRRTACHVAPLRHKTGTRVQFGPVDERIRKLLGHIDTIPTLDILEVETNFTSSFTSFRNSMIKGDCSKVFDDIDKKYKCIRIPNTSLTIGFILYKNKEVLELDTRVEKVAFEENELVGDWIREPALCLEFLSSDDELERFESLIDMAEKKAECLSPTHQSMLAAFTRSVNDWRANWPLMEENMTCSINPTPNGFHSSYMSSFVEYAPGIVSFYPNCQFSTVQQFFNNRPQILDDDSNNHHLQIHVDSYSHILTIFRAIFDNVTKRQIALVGAQFRPSFFNALWSEQLKKSVNWQLCRSTKGKCYIVNKRGYIIASSNQKVNVVHLAEKEPILFDQLFLTNYIKSYTVTDYQAKCHIAPRLHQTSTTQTSSGIRPVQLLSYLANMAYSWLTLDLFAQPTESAFIEDDCQYRQPENTEQCVMKYPIFELQINNSMTITIKSKRECTGSATIVPSGQLYAMHVEITCPSSEITSKHQFRATRVPECYLAKKRVRHRVANMDYTVTYPEENENECSYASNKMTANLAFILILFLMPKLF